MTWRNALLCLKAKNDAFLFQGGQLTEQESPVAFPNKLYSRIHNAEVSVDQQHFDPSVFWCSTASHILEIPPSLQVDSQMAFIRDSLKLIKRLWLNLYRRDNPSLAPWDTTKTENFLMIIFRQQGELKRCVSICSNTHWNSFKPNFSLQCNQSKNGLLWLQWLQTGDSHESLETSEVNSSERF